MMIEKTKREKLIKSMRQLEKEHAPNKYPPIRMSDISALCDLVEGAIPAIDLLQAHLEQGEYLRKQDGEWSLFDAEGDGVVSGKTLRDILLSLIWMDC